MNTNNNDTTTSATDLAIIEKTMLEKLNKSLAKSDLDDLLTGARRSLLLVDCSGSMGESINSGGRKIDALRAVVKSLRETGAVPIAAFGAAGADVQVVEGIPEPCGQTPLDRAIAFGQREGATHLVVVTDGEPDDEGRAFAAARAFGRPIDVFYIGDEGSRGASFCKELAAMNGGTANITDLGKPKQLAGEIRLMLGDGTN